VIESSRFWKGAPPPTRGLELRKIEVVVRIYMTARKLFQDAGPAPLLVEGGGQNPGADVNKQPGSRRPNSRRPCHFDGARANISGPPGNRRSAIARRRVPARGVNGRIGGA